MTSSTRALANVQKEGSEQEKLLFCRIAEVKYCLILLGALLCTVQYDPMSGYRTKKWFAFERSTLLCCTYLLERFRSCFCSRFSGNYST